MASGNALGVSVLRILFEIDLTSLVRPEYTGYRNQCHSNCRRAWCPGLALDVLDVEPNLLGLISSLIPSSHSLPDTLLRPHLHLQSPPQKSTFRMSNSLLQILTTLVSFPLPLPISLACPTSQIASSTCKAFFGDIKPFLLSLLAKHHA